MTEDQNKEFDLLQFADDLSYANWQTLKFLYNEKFREAEKRNKELEAAIMEARKEIEWWANKHCCCAGHETDTLEKIDTALAGEKKDDPA